MVIIYFSGTGNSKYIAQLFSQKTGALCHSIEENVDFNSMIANEEIIAFCYPIYGSRVPRIMREFMKARMEQMAGKKVIIFCTQLMFSGDGARVFTDIFPKNYFSVIYAEHFDMPNNVCNFSLLKITDDKQNKKYLKAAEQKMIKVCENIKNGKIKRRGFNIVSKVFGLVQGAFMPSIEKAAINTVAIDKDCNSCGICTKICPMNNLELSENGIIQKGNCTICYRCVNACPQRAITTFFHKKPPKQYKGVLTKIAL